MRIIVRAKTKNVITVEKCAKKLDGQSVKRSRREVNFDFK